MEQAGDDRRDFVLELVEEHFEAWTRFAVLVEEEQKAGSQYFLLVVVVGHLLAFSKIYLGYCLGVGEILLVEHVAAALVQILLP